MKKIVLILIALTGLFVLSFSETTADILNKIKAEYNGAEKQIKTMEMDQTITVINEKDKIVTNSKMHRKNDKFRIEMSIPLEEGQPPMVTTVLYDGKDIWTLLPMVGKQKMSGKDAEKYESEKDGQWWEEVEDMEYVGDEKIDGQNCYILVEKEEGVETNRMWINKAGLYPMKSVTSIDEEKLTTIYTDVKTIEGYKMPCKYSIYEKEKLMSEVEIKTMKINIELSDDLFDPEKLKSDVNVQDMFKGLMPKF
ncbi:MAG: outer membrane lipoprotein carrier protein LolA [bacterium]